MTDKNKIYYDSFANEYTLNKEAITPPERYLVTLKGNGDDIYIETYQNSQGERLDVAYCKDDVKENRVNDIRFEQFKRHNYEWQRATMIRWVIPSDLFDEYWDRFIKDEKQKNIDRSCSNCRYSDNGMFGGTKICEACSYDERIDGNTLFESKEGDNNDSSNN